MNFSMKFILFSSTFETFVEIHVFMKSNVFGEEE